MEAEPGPWGKSVLCHPRIGGLQVSWLKLLNRQRAEPAAEMLAQELGVAGPSLVADVAVRPVVKPPLNEVTHRFGARIDVKSAGDVGENLRRLFLRLGLRAA